MTQPTPSDATLKFREALLLASRNMPSEALHAFKELVETWPADELADDAQYNVGACYLAMNQFGAAAGAFESLLEQYPDATIASDENGGRESGRTAAKAWLGLLSARLGLGDVDGARAACRALADYGDSKIHPAPGIERSFHDVAESLLLAAEGGDREEVDEIGPEDFDEAARGDD
jgi:tetratricopeptide (TPR) repeat protein